MEFWVLWFIGIVLVIGTRIAINMLSRKKDVYYYNKIVQVVMHLLVMICIALVGGILVGKWIGNFSNTGWSVGTIIVMVITAIIGAVLTYLVGSLVLGLYHFDKWLSQMCFVLVFIVSIVGWSIPICKYNQNIEITTETVVEQKQENQLLYFCNIPVQEISGSVSGSSFIGIGSVSGEITTSENLPYWYLNKNGEGVYDSISAKDAKIVFIEDDESPYVKVIHYCTKTTTTNNNNGTEKTEIDKTWTKYIFYLPKEMMQYNLD